MYRLMILILVFTTLLGASSCNVPDTNVSSLENEIRLLKSTITNLDNRIAILEAKISPAVKLNAKPKKKQSKSSTEEKELKAAMPVPDQSASSAYASPTVVEPKPSTPNSGTTETYSGRCRATTKKGYQCSRNARSNGYCWQHGG